MKTRTMWIITILLMSIGVTLQAQTKQKGYTKTKGRLGANGVVIPGTRLSNVSVVLQGDNSTVSDAKGNFSLSVGSNKFYLKKVQKQGYTISDPDALLKQYTCSSNDLVLVLETPSEQLEDKLAAEKKIRSTLKKQVEQRENEIEKLKEQNKITQEEYLQRLQKLFADQDNDNKLISEMAERYSKMDFDIIDEFNRRISDAILNGRLAEADSLLNTKGDINQRIAILHQHQNANNQAEQELKVKQKRLEKSKALAQKELEILAQDCYSKFEIFKMQHQLDSATYYIEKRAELDPLKMEWFTEAFEFICKYIADYEGAIKYCNRILDIQKSILPENQINITFCYNNLAVIYAYQGKYDLALEYHMKALEIRKRLLPENHSYIAISYNNIAVVYANQGLYNKALEFHLKALHIQEAEDSQNIAESYNNIAFIYAEQGLYDKALEYQLKALEIQQATLPEKHPDIALSYNNIATIYFDQKLYDKALEFFTKALEMQKATVSESHISVAVSYNNIAALYSYQGEYSKALEYQLKALKNQQAILPENHPDIAVSYNNIAFVYSAQGLYDQALEYHQKALEIRKVTLPENHPDIAACYNNIALVYEAQGQTAKAEEYRQKANEISKKQNQ